MSISACTARSHVALSRNTSADNASRTRCSQQCLSLSLTPLSTPPAPHNTVLCDSFKYSRHWVVLSEFRDVGEEEHGGGHAPGGPGNSLIILEQEPWRSGGCGWCKSQDDSHGLTSARAGEWARVDIKNSRTSHPVQMYRAKGMVRLGGESPTLIHR